MRVLILNGILWTVDDGVIKPRNRFTNCGTARRLVELYEASQA